MSVAADASSCSVPPGPASTTTGTARLPIPPLTLVSDAAAARRVPPSQRRSPAPATMTVPMGADRSRRPSGLVAGPRRPSRNTPPAVVAAVTSSTETASPDESLPMPVAADRSSRAAFTKPPFAVTTSPAEEVIATALPTMPPPTTTSPTDVTVTRPKDVPPKSIAIGQSALSDIVIVNCMDAG